MESDPALELTLAIADALRTPGANVVAIARRVLDDVRREERERIIDEVVRPLGWQDGASEAIFIEISEIPKALRELRRCASLTLKQAAKKSGLSFSFISDIEHGRANPSFETLDLLMAAYGYKFCIALRPAPGGATTYCRLVNTAETRACDI